MAWTFSNGVFQNSEGQHITPSEIAALLNVLDPMLRFIFEREGGSSPSPSEPWETPFSHAEHVNSVRIYDSSQATLYRLGVLNVGELAYSDRLYPFISIPSDLVGKPYLQAANDTKRFQGKKVMEFTVEKHGDLFLAIQNAPGGVAPEWLSQEGWKITYINLRIRIIEDDIPFIVYQKSVNAGDVIELERYAGMSNVWILILDL